MATSRRDLLRASSLPTSIILTGCLGNPLCIGQPTIEIRAERATLSDSKKESINPIVFSELSEAEQQVARTGIEGEYIGCSNDAVPFVERVQRHQEAVGGDFITVYLQRGSEYYSLYVRNADGVLST